MQKEIEKEFKDWHLDFYGEEASIEQKHESVSFEFGFKKGKESTIKNVLEKMKHFEGTHIYAVVSRMLDE